ncbi:MAG: Ig-like domain-containing protein, partial [Sphingopyxis sp.]|nr:Ig-like domain-containing protein [Sphingopyxis sp.]
TIPAQTNGEELVVTQTDEAGNESDPTPAIAPDLTAPEAPTADVDDATGTIVTGTGEAGATITVFDVDGETVLGSSIVQPDGNYSVTIPARVNGETLVVTQTDETGNESAPVDAVAPDIFDAFDNSNSAGLDLVPVETAVEVGEANYVLLLSLVGIDPGLSVLGLQLLGIQPVTFTVEAGHELEADFEYGGVLDIGGVADYQVVVQQLIDGEWVGVGGDGELTLLDLALLNDNVSASDIFGPGEYRAFVTFDGLLGAGVLGTLEISGTDSDYTQIADIDPIAAEGNVITDPAAGGETDAAPPGTVIGSVTVDGVTTEVTADGTEIIGEYGTLVIDLDGSYVYTPSENAANIGATEFFTYTLRHHSGAEESAQLTITIGSPDVTGSPVAADDSNSVSVSYDNVVTTSSAGLFTLNNGPGLIIPSVDTDVASFTVGANSQSDARLIIDTSEGLSVLPSYTVTLRDGNGNVVGAPIVVVALANVAGIGTGAVVNFNDLAPGNYSITVSSRNTLGLGYDSVVRLDQTITLLDQFELDAATNAEGNLLDNDTAGSAFSAILVDTGAGFVEIGNTSASITGDFGTLTVDASGNYRYDLDPDLDYFTTDQIDSFTYQIRLPNGETVEATLDITVDVDDLGARMSGMEMTAGGEDVVALGEFAVDADSVEAPDDGGSGHLAYDLFEGRGDLVTLLDAHLGRTGENQDGASTPDKTSLEQDNAPAETVALEIYDPLSYLTTQLEEDRDLSNNSSLT